MKSLKILAILCAAVVAGCATSQEPAPASATTATATKPARTADQIRMDEILDNAAANAVFKKHAPTAANHPQLSRARGMTLAEVARIPAAGMSPEAVQAIVDDINKL